jgi:uncharacterized membrane protein
MFRLRQLSTATALAGVLLIGANSAMAENMQAKPQGLWLTTDFPAITESIGDNATLALTLQNSNEPPQRVAFSIKGLPDGWKWELDGAGKPVTEAIVTPDESRSLMLKITPPKDVKAGAYDFTVIGDTGAGQTLTLPVKMSMAAGKPSEVTLEAKLPALRGTPQTSFDYDLTIKNESAKDTTFNLLAQAPDGFQTIFKEQYGTQEISSLPFKAGESKTVKLSVKPPENVAAGQYPVAVAASNAEIHASTKLLMDVTGEPKLTLSAAEGRLSGRAEAGKEKTFNYTIVNDGSAPARDVKLDANAPTGWKIEVEPKKLDSLAPGATQDVAFHVTPTSNAIAGDYMVSLSANGDGASDHSNFRVTVATSTVWGVAGLGIIGAAVVVLGFAVTRYGRR